MLVTGVGHLFDFNVPSITNGSLHNEYILLLLLFQSEATQSSFDSFATIMRNLCVFMP